MITDVEKAIREYLPDILHMSLATCADNKPWVCEVHFAYDDDLNVYFRSDPTRHHSLEIDNNPSVAGNIVTQHGKSEKPRGVYFEGSAELLQKVDESSIAYMKIAERSGLGPEILEAAREENGPKFYKITVSDYYMFDTRESKPAHKYHLPWNSARK